MNLAVQGAFMVPSSSALGMIFFSASREGERMELQEEGWLHEIFNGFDGISNGFDEIFNGFDGIFTGFDEIFNGFEWIWY